MKDTQRKKELLTFSKKVGLKFKNLDLLDQAFFHRSISNEFHLPNNERLEFLGDSVLGLATASYLYRSLDNPEGDLAKIKASVVSEKSLAVIGFDFGLDKLMILGNGEEHSGGRQKPAIIADCMEAIIGAYYLDSGYKEAEKYVLSFIEPAILDLIKNGVKDYKSLLQEYCQKNFKIVPKYTLVNMTGPEHFQQFQVAVEVKNKIFGPTSAHNKKDAEQKAAEMAYKILINNK